MFVCNLLLLGLKNPVRGVIIECCCYYYYYFFIDVIIIIIIIIIITIIIIIIITHMGCWELEHKTNQ